LVLRLARETSWGFTRILGELKKLGAGTICRSTVVKILKEHGLDPGPKRGEGTWDEFIKIHAQTLCDTPSKNSAIITTSTVRTSRLKMCRFQEYRRSRTTDRLNIRSGWVDC
jgi:hypothetical protein